MNVLFVLYGDLSSNSAIPMELHARELGRLGHDCVAVVPSGPTRDEGMRIAHFEAALANPAGLFRDSRPADVVHAWTPRENVRRFVTSYLGKSPAPLVMYLEDNEDWIARKALTLAGMPAHAILEHTEEVIGTWTPERMPHLLHQRSFIGMADAAVVIQDKLGQEVPPWVPCFTVMPGVDLEAFAPRAPDPALRERLGVPSGDRVIVYPGGLNDFTRPGLEALCKAVGIIRARGVPCTLVRSGPVALDFLAELPADAAAAVRDVGVLSRHDIPELLALADVLVQPGKPDAFEDLRLPGKLPELLASGRPVVLPNVNIAADFRDGIDAVVHHTGSPEEIAEKCLGLFEDREAAARIGAAGRHFAETRFDPVRQASRMEAAYRAACAAFQPEVARATWGSTDAGSLHPQLLLARRLRLLGNEGAPQSAMLRLQAATLESSLERVRSLENGFAARDGDIARYKAEADRQAGEVAVRDGHISNLQGLLAEDRARLAELAARLADREAKLQESDGAIAAMKQSFSWRLTAPMRRLADASMRLGQRLGVRNSNSGRDG